MRIAYTIHGRGRGHAARSLPVVRRLRALGADVDLTAGGDARDLITDADPARLAPPAVPGASLWSTAVRRVSDDVARLRARRVDVVVTDGDMPSAIAARIAGVPCLAVGHDLVFSRCRLPDGAPRRALAMQRVNAWHTALTSDVGVAVGFVPLPARSEHVLVARPELPGRRGRDVVTGRVVSYFRDANGAAALAEARAAGLEVHHFGRTPCRVEGVHEHPFGPTFRALLRTAELVVASAGSNVISEAVQLGVPIVALHRRGDFEQELNGFLVEAFALGVSGEADAGGLAVRRALVALEAERFTGLDLTDALPSVVDAVPLAIHRLLSADVPARRRLALPPAALKSPAERRAIAAA